MKTPPRWAPVVCIAALLSWASACLGAQATLAQADQDASTFTRAMSRLWAEPVAARLELAGDVAHSGASWVPAILWVLGADDSPQVREAALAAAQARCQKEPAVLCARLLGLVTGTDDPVAWRARDMLLEMDAEAALAGASVHYKEDVLGRLGADPSLTCPNKRRLLRRLSIDDDARVQEYASWLLER